MQLRAEEAKDYPEADLGRTIGHMLHEAIRCVAKRGVASALKSDVINDVYAQYTADPRSYD